MTGSDARAWSWLHSVVVPVVLAAVEATWVSAWIGALARLGPHVRADVPFLALAVPGGAAALLAGLSGRLRWRTWQRTALVLGVALVGTAVAAGTIAAIDLHAGFAAVSLHPWTVSARVPGTGAALAWFIASLAWARGTWLAWEELTFDHALLSVGAAALAFVLLFVVGALRHGSSLHRASGPAAVLLLVFFPGAVAVVALVHERDLERRALRQPGPGPSMAWLAALAVPMAVVAALAVLVAFLLGPLAPAIGRGVRRAALWLASLVADLARWLARLVHTGHLRPGKPALRGGGGGLSHVAVAVHVPLWIWMVLAGLGVAGAGAALYLLLRMVLGIRRNPRRPRRAVVRPASEQRDSVFSWGHLLDQLRHIATRLLGRFRRSPAGPGPAPGRAADSVAAARSVRQHYRELLGAASAAGHARRAHETPLELERRLDALELGDATPALAALTSLYDRARYGDEPGSSTDVEDAGRQVAAVIASLPSPDGEAEPAARPAASRQH